MSDEQKLRELAVTFGLSQLSDKLVKLLKPSIYIKPTRIPDETETPVGASKFGGQPDFPVGESWVCWGDSPLTFLAQINLNELHPFNTSRLLPSTGMLYFFLHTVDYWKNDTKPASWRVIYRDAEQSQLRRATFPPDDVRPPEWEWARSFPACKLEFSPENVVPHYGDTRLDDIRKLILDENEYEQYDNLRNGLQYSIREYRSHLLGYADLIQHDIGLKAQQAYNGTFKFLFPNTLEAPERAAANWHILLQIDSENEANMLWGDSGRLYFCIKEDDLRTKRFDKVWMIFQCF